MHAFAALFVNGRLSFGPDRPARRASSAGNRHADPHACGKGGRHLAATRRRHLGKPWPPHHHTYSKALCWVAFDRAAAWLCDRDADLSERYRRLAANVREEVLEKGFDRRRNSFVWAYDDDALDAAVLRLLFVGLIDPCDERMIGTVAAIEGELVRGGLVWRYRSEDTDDGLEQGEGAFVAAGFWLADALHAQGRQDEARALFERLLGRANDVGLRAEELSGE